MTRHPTAVGVGQGAKGFPETKRRQQGESRDEVLSTARLIIASEGAGSLTTSKAAQRLKCAPESIYSYFQDLHDLLFAVAQEGFESLADRLRVEREDPPLERLSQLYFAYARLGLVKPNDYRILFKTREAQPPRTIKGPDQVHRENAAFAVSVERANA